MCLPIFSKVCKIYSVATTSLIINVNIIWWGRQGETEETEGDRGVQSETEGDKVIQRRQNDTGEDRGRRGDRLLQGETECYRGRQRDTEGETKGYRRRQWDREGDRGIRYRGRDKGIQKETVG